MRPRGHQVSHSHKLVRHRDVGTVDDHGVGADVAIGSGGTLVSRSAVGGPVLTLGGVQHKSIGSKIGGQSPRLDETLVPYVELEGRA